MEGCVQGGRWNKKAPVGTIGLLLLICMFIPIVTLSQPPKEQKCPDGDYRTDEGVCCNKCSPGFKLVEKCHADGQRTNCTACPKGQYMSQMNSFPNCMSCRICKKRKNEIEISPCERHQNTICRCKEGYYKKHIDLETYDCISCSQCRPDEKEKQKCTPESDTVCVCKENSYRVKRKCEPCKSCTDECKQHCPSLPPLNTKASEKGGEYLVNVIAGVSVVAVVLVALGIVITHMATKWYTKKRLQESSTQPSDDSSDSCKKLLVHNTQPSTTIDVEAVPQLSVSEQESLNLPDCVPLEVKIPELIYTVLDLVPVLQVKQLVRSLGVKDIEIEQAEFDHRSCCREAHYQMLRVWAETGSRTGGGGQGGMLHWPLLQELLDELRNMHLGRAAEELETKYGIQ